MEDSRDILPINNNNKKRYSVYRFRPRTYMEGTLILVLCCILLLLLLYYLFIYDSKIK